MIIKNNKIIIMGVMTFFLVLCTINPYQASSGKLRSDSICKGSDGQYYGQHSSDNHWHKAVEHDSGWYPNGGVVSGNPCNQNTPASSSASVVQEEPTNKSPVINMNSTNIEVNYSVAENDYNKEQIISLFGISASDSEDGNMTNLTINPDSISKNQIGPNEITISVMDSDGAKTEEKVVLNIIDDNTAPEITVDTASVELYESETPQTIDELIELLNLSIYDSEDGEILLTEDDVKIDPENSIVTITVKDELGVESVLEINYSIKEIGVMDIFLSFLMMAMYILPIIIIAIVIFFIIKSKKNKTTV